MINFWLRLIYIKGKHKAMRLALILARTIITIFSGLIILKSGSILAHSQFSSPFSGVLTPELVLFATGVSLGAAMLILQRWATAAFVLCMGIISVITLEGGAYIYNNNGYVSRPAAVAPAVTVEGKGAGSWSALPFCGRAGYCPPPASHGWIRYNVGGKPAHEFSYSVDAQGRRNSAIEPGPERSRFLMFFGCSFTYGQGISDDQTLPHYAGALAPGHMPYNYGVGGYGTNSMLAQIEDPRFPKAVPQKSGIGVYVMLEDHIFRSMGDSQTLTWGTPMPYYEMENGKPVFKGPFWKARPFYCALAKLVFKSQTASLAHVRLPRKAFTREDVAFVSALIKESARLMKKSYPDSRFVVLLYPANQKEAKPLWVDWMEEDIAGSGITILNYLTMLTLKDTELRVPIDGHPNGVAHELVARRMVEDLGLNQTEPPAGKAAD